jgi:hypothetical protein
MFNLLVYLPILVALSDREKRLIGILLFVVLALIFVVGIISNFFINLFDSRGKDIDHYLSDMLEFKIIKDPKHFRKYVNKREHRSLYLANKWPTRFFIATSLILLAYVFTALEGDYSQLLTIVDQLLFEVYWPTEQFFGFNLISNWPYISVPSVIEFSLRGYITYAFLFISIFWSLNLLNSLFNFAARSARASRYSRTSFGKSLDAFTYRGGNSNAPKV